MVLRDATLDDTDAIVALNAAVVIVTSPMDNSRFAELFALSSDCVVAEQSGEIVGFVLAMQQGAAHENENFKWFSERLNRFVYIDRIVIGPEGRGQGLGRKLYAHVAARAVADGCRVMCAEIDLEPPNETSLVFHERSGFVKLGERSLEGGKVVSMQVKGL